jgi:hypothetical protein
MTDRIAEITANICRDVAELQDRTSPAHWPEAMLVTADELTEIVTEHFKFLLSELATARREIEQWRKMVDDLGAKAGHAVHMSWPASVTVERKLADLTRERDEAREALRPFKEVIDSLERTREIDLTVRMEAFPTVHFHGAGTSGGHMLKEEDFRAAARAIKGE